MPLSFACRALPGAATDENRNQPPPHRCGRSTADRKLSSIGRTTPLPDLAPFALYNVSPFADMQGQQVTVRRPDFGMAKQSHVEALDFQAVAGWVFADHKPAGIAPSEDDDFSIEVLGGGEARPQDVRPSTDRGGSFAYGVYRHFCLNVVSVDATVAELRARGVTMVADPFVVEETSRRPTFVADHSAILSSLPR
jgi:glyoxylase I family protein